MKAARLELCALDARPLAASATKTDRQRPDFGSCQSWLPRGQAPWRAVSFYLLICVQLLFPGCSRVPGSIDLGGEEGNKVAATVEELNEVKHNPKKIGEFFVDKQGQADAKKLNQFTYYVAGKPSVTGTSATCKVLIEKANGTPVGEQEWTFEKVSDQWKIKSAPTP